MLSAPVIAFTCVRTVSYTHLQVPDSYVYRGADDQVLLYQADLKTPLHLGTSPRYHRK